MTAMLGHGLENVSLEYNLNEGSTGIFFLPPDPLIGGNMYTQPLEELFLHMNDLKLPAFRFSFNKYPMSSNSYDKYISQSSNCLDFFLRTSNTVRKIYIIGYSFGATIGLNLYLRRPYSEVEKCIMISPALTCYDHASYVHTKTPSDIVIISGTKDDTNWDGLIDLFKNYLQSKSLKVQISLITGANHYYHNELKQQQLFNEIDKILQPILN